MTTLKEARQRGQIDQFIKEREADAEPKKGDADAFSRAVEAMAQTSKAAPKASKKGNRGG